MNQDQFRRACDVTADLLTRQNPDSVAIRMPGLESSPGHLLWMLAVAKGYYFEGKTEKANRWLGYVQGSMHADGYATVDELKKANMPEGEQFDGDRV